MSGASKREVRIKDMTEGNPIRLVLSFALPLFIGNIFQQVYSMVDTMVAGYNLGDSAIAAIGASSSLYSLLINLAAGLNSGYAIIVTQSFGAHDEKRLKEAVAGMILLNGVVTSLLTVLALCFLKPLLHFMNTPEAIFSQAYAYIAIICGGMLATVCYNMFSGILRALGNSRMSLYFLIISCGLNAGMDLLFVAVLHMGVAGAALATVIAQTVSALLCGAYVLRGYRRYLPGKGDFHVSGQMFSALFSSGLAMALMLCVVDMGSVIFQRANNNLGETVITAHTAARRLINMLMMPLSTIAAASSTFVGQNWGAGKSERIKGALKQVLMMELGWALFSCAVIFAFGGGLVRLLTGTTDSMIIKNAVMSLRWHFAFYPALGILLCLRTAMQAMGQKLVPILSSCMELGMKILSAAWLIPRLGFVGTCITEPVTWVLMMVFLGVMYGNWQRPVSKPMFFRVMRRRKAV